jgi:predicted MFS family arabinose efflux permease
LTTTEAQAPAITPDARPRLVTVGFAALLVVTFLVYAQNFVIQAIIPLLVVDLGGDAALVGIVVAIYSFPSMVLRPFIGRIADERGLHPTWSVGTILLALCAALYTIPSLIAVAANRLLHGTAWAAFNTGGHATMARSAPADRRGQASSVYNLVIAVGQLAFPGIGILIATTYGFTTAFVLAGGVALVAFVVIRLGPVPRPAPTPRNAQTAGSRHALIERGALLPMLFEALFTAAVPLYFSFLPLFALRHDIPVAQVAIFFPIYGTVFLVSRLIFTPWSDRLGRRLLLAISVVFATAGLALGVVAQDLPTIILSGCLFAIGPALETPASMALAIDRSDPSRTGAAMATYSLGYQAGLGIGAALFGIAIAAFDFGVAFAIAVGMQLSLASLLVANWRGLPGGQPQTRG